MRAFHTNWTRPFTARNPGVPYAVEPFELLTTMLSALQWRALGGVVSMETDACGAAYYASLGLTALWNGGVRTSLEGAVPESVSPFAFWAAGKLYALRQMPAPCVMLDTDFIVWRALDPLLRDADAAVIHLEELYPDIYPDKSRFAAVQGFDLESLDWSVLPGNTALAYFGNAGFKDDYTAHATAFMECAAAADDLLVYMVFAEQRMISMRARACGAKLTALSDLPALFGSGQTYFTHVWGAKQQFRDDPAAYDAFCRRCAARLAHDFPGFAHLASAVPCLHGFFSPETDTR